MATAKKTGLLRVKPENGGGKRVIAGVVAQGSTLAGLAASKALEDKGKKYHGAVLSAIGIAASYFIEDENVAAMGTGLGCAGAVLSAKEYLKPEQKAALGLAGTMVDTDTDGGASLAGTEKELDGMGDVDLLGLDDEEFYSPEMFEDTEDEDETDFDGGGEAETDEDEDDEENEDLSGNADLT